VTFKKRPIYEITTYDFPEVKKKSLSSTFLIINQQETVSKAIDSIKKWLYPNQNPKTTGDYGLLITTGGGIKAWLMSEEPLSKYSLHLGDIIQMSKRTNGIEDPDGQVKLIVTYSPGYFVIKFYCILNE
jgi:hypothetical protein